MTEERESVPEEGTPERGEGDTAPLAGGDERGEAERGDGGERGRRPRRRARSRQTISPEAAGAPRSFTPEQRLMLLDLWQRSELPAREFAELAGVSRHTLYVWKKRFDAEGPAGLVGRKGGPPRGSRLPEPTKRAILMLKRAHPEWGRGRIHDELVRAEGLEASPGAIGKVLLQAGYVVEAAATRPHAPPAKRFERARPNQLWLMSSCALCAVPGTSPQAAGEAAVHAAHNHEPRSRASRRSGGRKLPCRSSAEGWLPWSGGSLWGRRAGRPASSADRRGRARGTP